MTATEPFTAAIGRGIPAILLAVLLGCDRYGPHSNQQEFVAEDRILSSSDTSLQPTVYRTRIVVDAAQGQVSCAGFRGHHV